MLIRTMEPAGAFQAFPDRMGRTNSSMRTRGAFWTVSYKSRGTVSAEPAEGRYAGTGFGTGFRDRSRSAEAWAFTSIFTEIQGPK